MLGMLTTSQHKEEIAHACHSASATPRDCTTLLYTMKGRKECRSVFCAVCGAGCTPLNWLQRHVSGGIRIPQVHADVGKMLWNKYRNSAHISARAYIRV